MKVTAFLGSPRVEGNTDILTERLLAGAKDAGCETNSFALRRLKIRPCIACDRCWTGGGEPCVFDDDMALIYNKIVESDVLVFATPVYWYGPTAIMKALIDRLVAFNRPQGRPKIEGKKVILITTYEEENDTAAEPLVRMFEMSCEYLGVELIERIVVSGIGPKGAILQRPEELDRAYQIGKSLDNG